MISEEDVKFVWEMEALELKINGGRFWGSIWGFKCERIGLLIEQEKKKIGTWTDEGSSG